MAKGKKPSSMSKVAGPAKSKATTKEALPVLPPLLVEVALTARAAARLNR
jgi:hypothetical protein